MLPKECLQVLRQFCPTSVSRIHSDEEPDARSEPDLLADEVEHFLLGLDGVLDALDLDGNDRKHLDGDAVELVEAAPGTGLRQTFVDVADRLLHQTHHHHEFTAISTTAVIILFTHWHLRSGRNTSFTLLLAPYNDDDNHNNNKQLPVNDSLSGTIPVRQHWNSPKH